MPYTDQDFKETNVNYINKDFNTIKSSLIQYAKSYFPDTYRDFNETSPGMMLLEMSAYVGDVLSFYMDQQYKEMMLPLAEERRNVVTLAKMLGYTAKTTVPAYAVLEVTQTVGSLGDGAFPNYSEAVSIEPGMQIQSSLSTNVKFESLDIIDFSVSSSSDPLPIQSDFNDEGIATGYDLKRSVTAISGETKTKSFQVGAPIKFLKLDLPEKNVVQIMSVRDSNGNKYHQVDFLAQDKVPIETHYSSNPNRGDAYTSIQTGQTINTVPVPYTLEFIRTSKRFVVENDFEGTTSVVFGNGILRSGKTIQSGFIQSDQAGIVVPGQVQSIQAGIDPLLGDEFSTLGETPSHTELTVKYRIGGGLSSNVVANDLSIVTNKIGAPGSPSLTSATLSVTNPEPARGGAAEESLQEIRERAAAFFTTQNRCVTKSDYEARILGMPAKFGNLAKVYVERSTGNTSELINIIRTAQSNIQVKYDSGVGPDRGNFNDFYQKVESALEVIESGVIPTIEVYTLSYDRNKNLTETPADPIGVNLKNYLNEFRMLTDEIVLRLNGDSGGGYIVNFGVYFVVVAHRNANKAEIKLKCIDKIRNYFTIDKMQFRQPVYVSKLEYELMNIDGVYSVNYVCISQGPNYELQPGVSVNTFGPLYTFHHVNNAWQIDESTGLTNYGYKFDFEQSLNQGVIQPSSTPSIFELKDPEQNIKGAVR